MKIKETRFVTPPDGSEEDDDAYADWIFKFHDNGWVLLAIRPDGLHIFGRFKD